MLFGESLYLNVSLLKNYSNTDDMFVIRSLKALLYCNTTITSLDVSGIPFRVRDIRLLSQVRCRYCLGIFFNGSSALFTVLSFSQGIAVAPLSTLRISDACLNSKHCAGKQ